MIPTDRKTLDRYESILQGLTRGGPRKSSEGGGQRREVHAALETYMTGDGRGPRANDPGRADPPFHASDGEAIAAAALRAASILRAAGAGRASDASAAEAGRRLETLIASQRPSGEFLLASRSDNPEPHWYHELVILHAVTAYALHTGRAQAWSAVERAAVFHLNETQPDHATTEPWALLAFLRNLDTLPLADQLLHAVQTQHPDRLDRVSWMLLRDALYSLSQLRVVRP